ncbi:cilia- and flagella-associated protein 206-like isoform X1 [Takifugu rubripes]|uniref:cilia- and flagella-associated protein 206-like isoform X1 n=2 Tax=Takifugu rubripes TaxID=31033 RepID=UPI0011455D95|nr:cilia- and flagella-associated protein 206-like isoform X1 [Takifugu rubripes]
MAFQTEGFVKKMILELQQQCAGRGSELSKTLVALMVKLVLSDPKNNFNADQSLTEEERHRLEELCLNKLTEKCNPSIHTIKMQEYFAATHTSKCQFLEQIRGAVELRMSPLRREITDSRLKTRDAFDALHSKIASYVLQWSNVGSPAEVNNVNQAKAALQSVFPHTEVGAFMALLKKDKEQQLDELTRIVTGICLFNKASMDEQQQPLMSFEGIEHELSASQCLVGKYTALLEELLPPEGQRGSCNVPVQLLKQALYNIRQYEDFLRILVSSARQCAAHMGELQMEFSVQMNLLRERVKAKRAVHTANVFPLFKTLSSLWCGLQEEAKLMKILHNIMLNLQPFVVSQDDLSPAVDLDSLLKDWEVKTGEERMGQSSEEPISVPEMTACEWLLSEREADIVDLPLQFNGFCGCTFVSRDGLLLPGNPQLGVLKHKGKFYVFSSKEAALNFASRPDDIIAEVEEKVKGSPELIHLLRLQQQLSYLEMWPEESSAPISKCESGTQTVLHPVATNIVRTYEWNAWELRKKAIRLANLLTKATQSTQTHLSSLRRENATQTWPPKDAASQSRRDAESNVPRPQVYLMGLRGQRDAQAIKVDLSRAVDE